MDVFIERDIRTNKGCRWHCCPTCHPAQTGPRWVYGCLHPAFSSNREGDFCPIVQCGGNPAKCVLKKDDFKKMIGYYKSGLTRSLNAANEKVAKLQSELNDLNELFK